MRRPPGDLATLRGAWWTLRATRSAGRAVSENGIAPVSLPRVPRLPASAERGVAAVLRRTSPSCLVRAIVLQSWHAAHGRRLDLVVGVTAPEPEFRAHAWLAGERPCHEHEYHELLRLPAA